MLRRALILAGLFSSPAAAHDAHRVADDTLAVVGVRAITTAMFESSYRDKLTKYGLTDNGATRQQYLQNLMDDEILIAHAKSLKLDRTSQAQTEFRRIQLQELLNAYAAKHLASTVRVTEDDLRNMFIRLNTKLNVRHLYAATREKADAIESQLARGRTFADLAKEVFSDPVLRDNGGSLGFISVDDMDPEFERAAYSLAVGEVSRPVKTARGYSIIRVDEILQNPLATESGFADARERLRGFVRKRKLEEAAREFTARLRRELGIRFNSSMIERLYDIMHETSPARLVENATTAISPGDMRTTVVMMSTGRWSLRKVLVSLRETAEQQRAWIHSRENLEDFIAGIIMRSHMASAAKREHLHASPLYERAVERTFDTYLLTILEDSLKKHIAISRDSLRSYFDHNRDRFASPARVRLGGILLDRAGCADSVRGFLTKGMSFEETARRFSIQKTTAVRGGDMGYLRRDELGKFATEIFALRPGEWTGPFVQEGNHLFVKCTGVCGPVYKTFEESAAEINDILVSMAWLRTRPAIVSSCRSSLSCRVYPERLMTLRVPSISK